MQSIFIQTPDESKRKVLARRCEQLHGIPYIIEAIDDLDIYVLAPIFGGEDYHWRKLFHLITLQGIVGPDCMLWDYEFTWA